MTSYDISPYDINFFHDFMIFLERLRERPIKRTLTGAISLADIGELMKQFKTRERIEEYQKFGWRIHRADELDFLTQIKLIAESMFLTYRRKGLLHLSKNGKGFLENLNQLAQYKEMILHYWYRVNWGYFTPGEKINGYNMAEKLQKHQNTIWQELLKVGRDWVDYQKFCDSLIDLVSLQSFIYHDFDPKLHFHINLILFERNLKRLGCVEVKETSSKQEWRREIFQFRSTRFGLDAYSKALYKNYL